MSNKKTNQIPHNKLLNIANLVYRQTIGRELVSTSPTDMKFINDGICFDNLADYQLDNIMKEVKRLASYNFFVSENQCPSKHALEGVKRLLARDANIHDIEGWEIINGDYDMYRVISPSYTWGSLCGSEYIVDLMNDTVKLISMS